MNGKPVINLLNVINILEDLEIKHCSKTVKHGYHFYLAFLSEALQTVFAYFNSKQRAALDTPVMKV